VHATAVVGERANSGQRGRFAADGSLARRADMGIFKNTRDFTAPGAGKEHTSEVRGKFSGLKPLSDVVNTDSFCRVASPVVQDISRN